ncbi:MAG: 3-deoxy-8-phosphooctulonate synthase [Candidatus Delongbacteria bacterium]|nr:3-deoxy-8-phosphooctulonate synthase [Candidatus Delongbacteria bacterium]
MTTSIPFMKSDRPFFILGPCVIEDESTTEQIAARVAEIGRQYRIPVIFKASFDKANRNSIKSFRGPGLEAGLNILTRVGKKFNLSLLTDIHECHQAESAAKVVDILQIPAFLCRQTDLVVAAASTGRIVNVKKGQFMDPDGMRNIIDKIESTGNRSIMLTERGVSFGYRNLVVDYRSLVILKGMGYPVVFDATHSVQLPGARGAQSGGEAHFVPYLARAAASIPVDGFFFEIHPTPAKALSDSANMLDFDQIEALIPQLVTIHAAVSAFPSAAPSRTND